MHLFNEPFALIESLGLSGTVSEAEENLVAFTYAFAERTMYLRHAV